MRFSQAFIPTLKDAPRDADTLSAKLMFRSGMIRKLASGLYDWLPLGLRVLRNAENIIREELNAAGGQEVWLPQVQPRELWEETGRWKVYGKELLRFKDRKGTEFCFAPTAEEVITDLVRRDVRSYRQLPLLLYQFGAKFRDEIRPRFGVMRAREFYMKDAYSFHATERDLEETYGRVFDAYVRIFRRCGFDFQPVEAETGAIGGSFSHEFMVLADTGEEEIASCSAACGFAANVERAECVAPPAPDGGPAGDPRPEEVPTPGAWTVEDVSRLMGAPKDRFIKTMFYLADGAPLVALVRGDCQILESKLARAAGASAVERMPEEAYAELARCDVGFAGPVGLKERCLSRDPRCRIIADHLVPSIGSAVSGANKKDTHLKNIRYGRDYRADATADLRQVREGDLCPRCHRSGKKNPLKFSRGIEVGHTFKLGVKYSEAMGARYRDESGGEVPMVMGCYGIGVSRIVAAAIEQSHDADGIVWTKALAPVRVEIIPVKFDEPGTRAESEKLARELEEQGFSVLLDDRDERAGVKFKDADLIGIPLRLTVSEKTLAAGCAELKARKTGEVRNVPLKEVADAVRAFYSAS